MRAAVLASKRTIDSQQVSRREELLRSSAVREKQTLNEKVTWVPIFLHSPFFRKAVAKPLLSWGSEHRRPFS